MRGSIDCWRREDGEDEPDLPKEGPGLVYWRLRTLEKRATRVENRQWALLAGIALNLLATIGAVVAALVGSGVG